ncbi:MAG: hypothetical protein ABIA67_05620 [Candidatus Margulisiibacteriota bacterium]
MKFSQFIAEIYHGGTNGMPNTKIINIASLRGDRGYFHPSLTLTRKAKAAVAAANNRAVAAVHPYFAGMHIFGADGQIRDWAEYGWLYGHTSFKHYGQHIRLFNQYLANSPLPLLLFVEQGYHRGTLDLVKQLKVSSPLAISITTEPFNDRPVLNWSPNDGHPWKTLAGILKNIGIEKVYLMGELGYQLDKVDRTYLEVEGCAFGVGRGLKAHGFSVRYLRHMIFPNVPIPCASR